MSREIINERENRRIDSRDRRLFFFFFNVPSFLQNLYSSNPLARIREFVGVLRRTADSEFHSQGRSCSTRIMAYDYAVLHIRMSF